MSEEYDDEEIILSELPDDELVEQYRAEYRFTSNFDAVGVRRKLEAKNYELATGIDAEVFFGRKYFTSSIYYESPFAPMFIVNDSLYLFDYHIHQFQLPYI